MATYTQPYGIPLPITHGPQGYFNQSYTLLDQVKSNLKMLLQTKKGERRMNPEFGSGLWSVLFENSTDDLRPIIESTIRKDIANWMSYVNVQEVEIADSSINPNLLQVSLTFTVPTAGITQKQNLMVSMNTSATS